MLDQASIAARLAVMSDAMKRTCAALVGPDARCPAQVAEAEGVSYHAIILRRRRLEKELGITLPRLSRTGRPLKSPTIGLPESYDLSRVG